jgi:hypothetical protein
MAGVCSTFEVFGNLEGLSAMTGERETFKVSENLEGLSATTAAAPLWLISQFWQNWQVKLQPTVPSDSTGWVGRKWKSGFFSMGSTCSAAASP